MVVLIYILMALIAIALAGIALELSLKAVFKIWNEKRKGKYDDVALHIWDRNDRPAYRDYKRHAVGKHIYYQDYVGYLQYPFESTYFNLNEHGFRAPSFPLKNLTGRYRVLMLGASALEGVPNCADEEIISYHLQRELNENLVDMDVINAGIRSYRIRNELNLLYRLHDMMDFDAIVVFDGYADFVLGRSGNQQNGYPRISDYTVSAWDARTNSDDGWYDDQAQLLRRLRRNAAIERYAPNIYRFASYIHRALKSKPPKKSSVATLPSKHADESMKSYLNSALLLMLYAKHFQKPLLFVHQPALAASDKPQHPNEDLFLRYQNRGRNGDSEDKRFRELYRKQAAELGRLCREHDVPFLDAQPIVDKMSAADDVFFDGVHMNSNGNRAVAEAIGSVVRTWKRQEAKAEL